MRNMEKEIQARVRRVEALYSVGGVKALADVNRVDVQLFLSDKFADQRRVERGLAEFPHDELAALRKEKLEREIMEIATWLKYGDKELDREDR